jgi:hypothetical protein
MSIAIMEAGEAMGRGLPRDYKREAEIRARLKSQAPEMIAVLGAGPSGLLAAHAIALAGRTPVVISAPGPDGAPVKSQIGPATYLHKAIPDLTGAEPDAMIRFVKLGTSRGYALKVYGSTGHSTSWSKFEEGEKPAWDLAKAYDSLWERYAESIVPMSITPPMVTEFLDDFSGVISTIPADSLCVEPSHSFPFRVTWVTPVFSFRDERDPIMVYDGRVGAIADRFRSSRVFGKCCTEYARLFPEAGTFLRCSAWNRNVRWPLMIGDLLDARAVATAHLQDWALSHNFDDLPTTEG